MNQRIQNLIAKFPEGCGVFTLCSGRFADDHRGTAVFQDKMTTPEEFSAAFRLFDNKLGRDRLRVFHSHFSRIEYTEKGGEKRHLTFEDRQF